MNIQRMEYFLVVAKYLNFSKAAEHLYVSHQALSKQIRLLEEDLGARLLERDTVRVVLTEIGRKAVELYTPLSVGIQRCEEDLHAFILQKKTSIRIGYFNGLPYRNVVSPVVELLTKEIPDVTTTITALDSVDAYRMLAEDQIDLLITVHHDNSILQGLKHIPLLTLPQRIIVSEYHPWYDKASVSVEDIAQADLVCYEDSFSPNKQFFAKDLPVKGRIFVRNVGTYTGVLAQGKAFGIVSDLHNQSEGKHRLLDLPEECASEVQMIALCKPRHPRVDVFELLSRQGTFR